MSRALVTLLLSALAFSQDKGPVQPLPFSHKTHIGAASLSCSDCHAMPDPGEVISFPSTNKCMACHRAIKTDSPAIKELKNFADQKRTVPWVRVYEIPSWVYFSHKTHVDAKTKCEDCHGPVGERDRLFKEVDLSMKGCMDCHKARKATLDCGGCHELKN